MRRPPFTMKTLENLECLVLRALGARVVTTPGRDGKAARLQERAKLNAAMEWIAAMRHGRLSRTRSP